MPDWNIEIADEILFVRRPERALNEHESLTSVAEFAIGLAGFSGIVVALGKRPGRWAPADRIRLLNVLLLAFGAGFMAYFPMVLAHAGLSGSLLWRSSSGGFLCAVIPMILFGLIRMQKLPDDVKGLLHPFVYWLAVISGLVTILAQLLNMVGLGFQPQFAPYFLGLVILLLNGAIQFARMLFARPE